MTELCPGVFLVSHHVDGLELSCSVDQVPNLNKPWKAKGSKRETEGKVKRDNRTASMACDLEAKLDIGKRKGQRLNREGHRAVGWQWRDDIRKEPVRLLPFSPRPGYSYALETTDWLLLVAPFRSPRPRFSFQLRAEYLLEAGAKKAFTEVVRWWTRNINPLMIAKTDEGPIWRISRIDLAADLAGVDLEPNDLPLFIASARSRKERHASQCASGRYAGRRFTGFEFGKRGSQCFTRIYDKTFEAAPDAPIREAWSKNGYRPELHGERVWRIEFELRSGMFLEMLREDGTRLSDDPARLIAQDLDGVWREAVVNRLTLKERTGDERPERRPVRDWWSQLETLDNHQALSRHKGIEFKRSKPVSDDAGQFLESARRSLATVGVITETESFDDCLQFLGDFNEVRGGQEDFLEQIAKVEARRDPSRRTSKQAISLRAREIAEHGFGSDDSDQTDQEPS